jgi:hypothetical protein
MSKKQKTQRKTRTHRTIKQRTRKHRARKHRKLATTKRARRNARPRRHNNLTPRQYFSKSLQFQQNWDDVVQTISLMRRKRFTVTRASEEIGIDPNVVIRLGRSGLRRKSNGTYVAKKSDRLLRVLKILTPDGIQTIAIRDSRQASQLGKYWDAVQRYLQTGDTWRLKKFKGTKIIDAKRKKVSLLTDTSEINRLASAGFLSFESLYGAA